MVHYSHTPERTPFMNNSFLLEAIDDLPLLYWDTAFPAEELIHNKPYRNAGDLLVKRSPTNRDALRLCGCDASVLDGTASDYECFSALCIATPMLTGHRSAILTAELLLRVFGLEVPLSPYQTEEFWAVLNQAIEDADLRPSDVEQALNVESICYRHPALSTLPKLDFPGVDLYPVFDLADPVGTLSQTGAATLADAVALLKDRLTAFREAGCVSARMILPKAYRFVRNSKKKEIDDLLLKARGGNALAAEEQNPLLTAFAVSLSALLKEAGIILLLETKADADELTRLFDYLALNAIVPETVLTVPQAEDYQRFLLRHTVRTEKGLPSLLPVEDDLSSYAKCFPIGAAILPQRNVCDVLSLAEGFLQRKKLASTLLSLGTDLDTLSSLAEDITYGNIKNRFGI